MCKCVPADPKCQYFMGNIIKCVPADPKCKYSNGNMCKWLGGHGKLCFRIRRQCVLHKNINISFEICINVFKILIFHLKYMQFCSGYTLFQNVNISFEICVNVFTADSQYSYFIWNMWKSFHNVNISFEICVNVLQLIQNVNISFEICANVSGSCAGPFKILIFHLKYV